MIHIALHVLVPLLFVLPLIVVRRADGQEMHPAVRVLHVVGLGLLIHMALDGVDCIR
jgi:hypothetical protein